MHELIELFSVPIPPKDFAIYQTLSGSINTVLNCIDRALADRDADVDRFCTHLDKDIAELGKELKEVKAESQNPMILDAKADQQQVEKALKKMHNQMEELQQRAYLYKSYQKNFKVEVTKYDELEEVYAELRLKQLLWDSIRDWDNMLDEWRDAKWDTIDPEDMTSTTTKYAKSVYQLEKGLPPNGVVPMLKQRVDDMRDKVRHIRL